MTAPLPRYILERDADDAQAEANDLRRWQENLRNEMQSMQRGKARLHSEGAVDEAINLVEQAIDCLILAERDVRVPDLDNIYPGRSAPGSFGV